jgi:hypothetical protein
MWDSYALSNPRSPTLSTCRYSNAAVSDAVPGAIDSTDPGPGINLPDMDTSLLVPAVRDPAPDVTRVYPVSFAFELTADGQFLGFMNNTVYILCYHAAAE